MTTKSKVFGPTAGVAATKTALAGSAYTLPAGTRKIRKLRWTIMGETITENMQGYVILEIDTVNGPFEFPLYGNVNFSVATGASLAGGETEIDIPIPGAGILTISVVMADTIDGVEVGVEFE